MPVVVLLLLLLLLLPKLNHDNTTIHHLRHRHRGSQGSTNGRIASPLHAI